ncbi:MAG: hypothetical protein ACOVQ0_17670, partial [Novosphingobium sp.]|uniref:hypothetical protein n=1 Tax=Novosphingobium sp. TaxID=1874826 RepID=UPI003B990F47
MSGEIPLNCRQVPMWEPARGISNAVTSLKLRSGYKRSFCAQNQQAKKDPAVARRVGKFWERMP